MVRSIAILFVAVGATGCEAVMQTRGPTGCEAVVPQGDTAALAECQRQIFASEREDAYERRAAARAAATPQDSPPVNCTTQVYGSTAYTNCH